MHKNGINAIKKAHEMSHWQHGGGISDAPNLNDLFGDGMSGKPVYPGAKPGEYNGQPVQQ